MIRAGVRRLFHLALRRRDRWEREVEDEITLHLALRAEQLAAQGAGPRDAYDEALRRFGPLSESRARLIEAARHREQRMHRTEYLDDLQKDLAFAFRTLGRQKAWTAVTILTLAFGIGATTAVFSTVSTLLLHPLPYPHADRIVYVDLQPSQGNNTGISVTMAPSTPIVREWLRYSRSFEALEGTGLGPLPLKTTNGEPSFVRVASIFPSFLDFAGQRPILGRMFTALDIESGRNPILVGEGFWRDRLGARRDVLGQTLTLHDSMFTIVGVVPAALQFGGPAARPVDVWRAIDMHNDKGGMAIVGRLRPGVTRARAAKELDSISARASNFSKLPFTAVITTPAQRVSFHDSLMMLAAAVALVLLVACANVAHLLLARSATRQREMAIRAALGAGRARLLRQLLTESLILSVIGTTCGVLVGWGTLRGMIALRPQSLDSLRAAHLDGLTLALAIGIAVVSAAAFAVIGHLQSARYSTHGALKNGSAAPPGRWRHGRGRGMLVISEMALSGMLLVGATLLVRSVMNLNSTDLGFDPRGLYAINVALNGPAFEADASRAQFVEAFALRVRALPKVRSVTVANVAPGSRWFSIGRLEVEGEAPPPHAASSFIDVNAVQPGYFGTMGMRLREGSTFTDSTPTSKQIIVNEGFARKHWTPGASVGHRVRIAQSDSEPWLTIVGVVNDARTSGALSESSAPAFYTPTTGHSGFPAMLIRTSGGAASLALLPQIATQLGVKRLEPPTPVVQTMSSSIAGARFIMLLLTILTTLALGLAVIGLYGVMTYTVAQQTREIGIRVALGASGDRIARGVIARGAALAVIGALVGLAAAMWGTRVIESQLYGVQRLDPVSFAVGAGVLVGAALIACIVPTRRALAVDPITAIRAD